ncbi:MAG: metal-dependent phosphohydrolase [Oculatellaceae cyanobacterium Prado106]|jgi:DICT domain-containing protein|nr:metal-dependent phosphohydrolase [Oculatellaceae cyanobacterium Prado106]
MLKGSILQQLQDLHHPAQAGKRPLNFGVYYKNTLVALCHALEDAILSHDYEPLVLTAFQRGKWYLQEADRYGLIADRSPQIVIMAASDAGFTEHATSQRQNVSVVGLNEDDPVAQEWHLVIVSPHYTAMVLCQELSEADYKASGLPQHDLERKFYGFWTFEPGLVIETAELMTAHLGRYNPALQEKLQTQLQEIAAAAASETALCHQPTADHLGDICTRIVDYLQTTQQTRPPAPSLYTEHPLDRNLTSNELQAFLRVAQLIDQTDLSNPMAAAEVASLAEAMGQLLDLPAWQVHRLRLAGLLHRVALLPTVNTALSEEGATLDEVPQAHLSCSLLPGVLVLRKMGRLKAIATILTHQSEHWNGSGQPAALSGDEIPLESRILGLAIAFQHRVAQLRSQSSHSETDNPLFLGEALQQCESEVGDRWDPKLVTTLTLLVKGLQQGMSLPVALPKIAAGLWLLDSHSDEEVLTFLQEMEQEGAIVS